MEKATTVLAPLFLQPGMSLSQPAGVCCEQTPMPAHVQIISESIPAMCCCCTHSEEGTPARPCAGQGWMESSRHRKLQDRPLCKQLLVHGREHRSWCSQWSEKEAGCHPKLLSHPQCPQTRDIPCLNLLGLQAECLSRCLISSLRPASSSPAHTLNYTPPENALFR